MEGVGFCSGCGLLLEKRNRKSRDRISLPTVLVEGGAIGSLVLRELLVVPAVLVRPGQVALERLLMDGRHERAVRHRAQISAERLHAALHEARVVVPRAAVRPTRGQQALVSLQAGG